MFSRLAYTLRETFAGFQRNVTLTVAAIITSAVSLLIFGLTLLIQHGFDNLLERWEGGVEMIVFVSPGTQPDGLQFIEDQLTEQIGTTIERFEYCDVECSLADADIVLAGDPTTRELLDESNIPTLYKVVPTDSTEVAFLRGLKQEYQTFPSVLTVTLAEDQLDLISRLQSFVSTYTTALWIALMLASGLLIWNTIRTAMFARRREIEVMKLVGATDWFIRIPFMLEGLIQGLLGGTAAVGAMLFINWRWSEGVKDFPDESGMTALVVVDGYQWTVALVILAFGALVGMIGSGIAASRFLDV
ncbi:MAG: FtsX-like permease family protein [Ilumatobacter sp.]|uniref:cell division protein FtsX n=1 Tax=Ilumatobacter sp. TaxID=1967498 RepID=UPI00262D4489|nr:FtsX-like permease family protein [Ilumatobacter sp.]MDJ0769072.1 FtsX-like permease family protein [Ilumatobacter sp.]